MARYWWNEGVLGLMMRSRYYLKILLQILAAAVVPALVVGVVLTAQMYKYISERMEQMEKLALQQTVSRTEEQLKSVQRSVLQFLVQQDTLNALRKERLIDDFQLYNRLRSSCSSLVFTSHAGMQIDAVSVVNLKNQWIYDTDTYYHDSIEEVMLPSTMMTDGWTLELRYVQNVYFKYVPVEFVLSGYANFLNQGIVVAKINYDDFRQNFDLHNSVSRIYIIDSAGAIIYDGTTENLKQPARMQPIISENGTVKFEMDGKPYTGIAIHSDEFDWTYLSVREDKISNHEIWAVMAFAFGLSLLIIIVAALCVSRLSTNLYRPVYNLSQRLDAVLPNNVVGANDKGVNELHRLERSVSDIIGNNSRLKEQLDEQRLLNRELMIYRLFTGQIQTDADEDSLELQGIHIPWKYKALIGIRILEDNEKIQDDIYMVGIHKIISNEFPKNTLLAPVMINRLIVLIIGSNFDSFEAYAKEAAYEIHRKITESLEINVQLALGRCYERIAHVPREFDKIKRVLNLYRRSEGSVILLSENQAFYYPHKDSDDIVTGVRVGKSENIDVALDRFLAAVFEKGGDLENQQMCMMWLVGDILRLTPDYSGYILNQAASSQKEDLIRTLSAIDELEGKKEWLMRNIINPVTEILHTDDANKLFLVNRMLSFISENTQNVGDIETCAAFLNYNSSYLRKIFKNKMGVSYGQYASSYLLTRAKEMLIGTDLPIGEIAKEIGYSNSQNFIRYFKREFGITPGQYRSSQRNGD